MKIIAGLGNPGDKYKNTRHNVVFMVLDYLAKKEGLTWTENKKLKAHTCQTGNIMFVKPTTFMNNSGQSVQAALSYYKLLPKTLGIIKSKNSDLSEVLTVIHDDLDIAHGNAKVSTDSGSAGHNGIKSIINHLKTKNFKRLRIGIKPGNDNRVPVEKYVLQNFNNAELQTIEKIISNVRI